MNIVFVLTYVVKYEERTEFQILIKRFLKFKKENPKAFEGLKSWRLFQREYGGVAGSYVEMWECRSLEELDKVNAKNDEIQSDDGDSHGIPQADRLHNIYGVNMEYGWLV
ncbi:MAG: hypothetical protein WCD81_04920 [Candidatus Bathyarchaeia archaeon]